MPRMLLKLFCDPYCYIAMNTPLLIVDPNDCSQISDYNL